MNFLYHTHKKDCNWGDQNKVKVTQTFLLAIAKFPYLATILDRRASDLGCHTLAHPHAPPKWIACMQNPSISHRVNHPNPNPNPQSPLLICALGQVRISVIVPSSWKLGTRIFRNRPACHVPVPEIRYALQKLAWSTNLFPSHFSNSLVNRLSRYKEARMVLSLVSCAWLKQQLDEKRQDIRVLDGRAWNSYRYTVAKLSA